MMPVVPPDCFAEPVLGRRAAPTRGLAMTAWGRHCEEPASDEAISPEVSPTSRWRKFTEGQRAAVAGISEPPPGRSAGVCRAARILRSAYGRSFFAGITSGRAVAPPHNFATRLNSHKERILR